MLTKLKQRLLSTRAKIITIAIAIGFAGSYLGTSARLNTSVSQTFELVVAQNSKMLISIESDENIDSILLYPNQPALLNPKITNSSEYEVYVFAELDY